MDRALAGSAAIRQAVETPRRAAGLLALPLILLCAQVVLFIWMAPRGIDLTDESYYFLNYLHWREFSATATFFGAYFAGPFHLLGQHVAAIRVFGMVLLLCAGAFLAWQAIVFVGENESVAASRALPFVVCGTASSLFYYSYGTTLRAPSYNLLVLSCMLGATGLLLHVVGGRASRRRACAAAFAYGLLLGACALGKATSALAMVLCHGVFLGIFYRRGRVLELSALALAGIALNFCVLQLMQPHWFRVLREGVTLTTTLDGRYAAFPFASLWDSVVRGAARLLPALAAGALLFVFVVRRWGGASRILMSSMVVVLVCGTMLTIQLQGYGKSWWALMAFSTALLWLAGHLCLRGPPTAAISRRWIGLSIFLFTLPVCYSIGTNGSLPAHTEMAAIFGVVALTLPLRRLFESRLIHSGALSIALAAPCVLPLLAQVRSLSDPSYTYRLRVGIKDQQTPLVFGSAGDALRVDPVTADSIETLVSAMHGAGYVPGEPLLDFTGDGPGLVYALGGRPVGVPWLIGGYRGSERVAALVLDTVDEPTLRRAWLISADGSARALRSWPLMLNARLGGASHQFAGSIPFRPQYALGGGPPGTVTLSLWKPMPAASAGASVGTR